jgi:ABC-2 type transport system ATP-binding protein
VETDRAPNVLAVANLRKQFRGVLAVDGVSFTVGSREIVGLLGPNGAGKTTTINMILGVLEATSGAIEIEGLDISRHRTAALERTNFAAVYAPLPGNLTVRQNLRVFGLMYGVPDLSRRIDVLLKQYDLLELADAKCGVLSSGEQTRAALAKAMLNQPQLLLLDEPTASGVLPPTAPAASCGLRTTCTKCRRSATACCFSPKAGFSSRAIPKPCPPSTARRRWKSCSSPWPASR